MSFNNKVYGGYQCWTCREVFDSMWDVTCNNCRDKERKHQELIEAIKLKS